MHSKELQGQSFFFFQAEDGIRDVAVTGVQTCALPISSNGGCCRTALRAESPRSGASRSRTLCAASYSRPNYCRISSTASRSEEHTSELQSRLHLVCRLLLEKKK